ncbi:rod shape-determining protein MreD [uncultured Pseudosulfitobacter sp.]|jgi:rod shape-determining protein MreD|uniref:rod shape-determining protein MreD n=1 Tax=uncultured Pseudosulfitobacter sp. TaxID=2854214 RepID=UPI0030DD581B|tara:strand:- start:31999 stop:32538 length:540 start_codon:yes stop_codon:yes gene_type:complete
MSEQSQFHLWMMRAGFCVLVLVILFFQILPLQTQPGQWAPPDLLIGFVFAWSVRRPEYVPPLMLAILLLLADLLLQRPPGLYAALVLLASENLKARARALRASTLMAEFLTVAMLMVAVAVAYRLVHKLMLIDTAPMGLSLLQLGLTILSYPLVVLVTHSIMRVRKTGPGDLETAGGRI